MNSCFIISLCLSSSFFFINIFSTEAAPAYLFHDCPNTTLFTPNSTYRSNLRILLSSLSSAATGSADGFANAAAGQNPPDRAYGLFLCRGDLNSTTCSHCVATGKRDILQRCPNQRVSTIWYDQCMLRYSNWPILSAMEQSPDRVLYYDIRNVTDPTRFMQLLGETLNDIATRASAGGSAKKVAVAEANFTNSQKLYALAHCTPDLTASDCVKCLQFGIANLPQGKQGGRLLAPSCNLRYELYSFYNASALPSPAPPPPAPAPPAPAPVTGPEEKRDSPASLWPHRLWAKVASSMAAMVWARPALPWELLRTSVSGFVMKLASMGVPQPLPAAGEGFVALTLGPATTLAQWPVEVAGPWLVSSSPAGPLK
ncbi:hypothetical protein NL676_007337 [Syzygium grande]|nr:hypothetical protein NL676_007337 [Syzygium grande]